MNTPLTYVYVVEYEDLTGMASLQGVFTTKEKAQACVDRMLAEMEDGEPMYSVNDFNIERMILE